MPSKTSHDNLASFIRQLHAATLTSVLIELAADHAAVHERLVRLQLSNQPKALATVFRKLLGTRQRCKAGGRPTFQKTRTSGSTDQGRTGLLRNRRSRTAVGHNRSDMTGSLQRPSH